MPETSTIELEPAANLVVSHRNGKETIVPTGDRVNYSVSSTLEQLPGTATNLNASTTGEELGQLFSQQPDLPGAILFKEDSFAGVISQAHYYKCISRAFGREIYYRRPAIIMLEELLVDPLILPSDCTIDGAVEQCLARPAEVVYEPFLVHNAEANSYRLCAFQMLLFASSQVATLRNRQMEQILNSVTDGLLVIDKNFRIGGEYSKVVGKIFERNDLRDIPLPEVLQPLIDSTTHDHLQDYLRILFDPKLIDRLIKSINPAKQISARFPSAEARSEKRVKHFAFNFERIRVQAEISQVLVRIEDITQRMNLAKELEQQEAAAEEKLHLVMQILQIEPESLTRFLSRYDEMLGAVGAFLKVLEKGQPKPDQVQSVFREVHTLKGEASLLHLTAHERGLHKFEDQLDKLRTNAKPAANDLSLLWASGETLQKLGDQIHEALDQLKQLGSGVARKPSAGTNDAKPADVPATDAKPVASAKPKAAASLVDTMSRLITDLSGRLSKPVTFHSTLKDADFPERHRDILHDALVHLTRNSMVHGIESTEERVKAGKTPAGLIQLEIRSHPEFHEVIFQDDGRGLDFHRIKQRAQELGWNLTTEEELRNAIFEPGFSTADKVTDLAGRGVGLDAIRHSLKAVKGRIMPYSEPGSYCAFQILLPKAPTPNVT